nr:MAG TPA: hypothetical protein [Caudoviricetes sp.]
MAACNILNTYEVSDINMAVIKYLKTDIIDNFINTFINKDINKIPKTTRYKLDSLDSEDAI